VVALEVVSDCTVPPFPAPKVIREVAAREAGSCFRLKAFNGADGGAKGQVAGNDGWN
jgi:hypothetical protein